MMRTRRVCIITPFQLSVTGGVTNAVAALRDEFIRAGLEVSILVPSEADRVEDLGTCDGARMLGIYMRLPLIEGVKLRSLTAFGAYLPITLLSLYRFLRDARIDVVMIQYPVPWMIYLGLLRRISRWKLVLTYQGNDAHDLPTWSPLDRRFVAALIKSADAVVAVSRSLCESVVTALPGVAGRKLHIIPNGATDHTGQLGDAQDPPTGVPREYIISVGSLIHRKGMDTLVLALRIAADRGCHMKLVLVGDGAARQDLEQLVRQLRLESAVTFAGTLPQDETLAAMRHSLFFVLASRAEGLPLVIVEAMACGKAVVATRVDGIPEIVIDGTTGLLVPPDDPESLAAALIALHGDDDRRNGMAEAGTARFREGFTWTSIARRYTELFEELGAGS